MTPSDAQRRLRVAAELHNLVAHRVSAIGVQAAAARLPTAGDAADAILALQREAMSELGQLRRLLAPPGPPALAPAPTLASVHDLARRLSVHGVELEVHGLGSVVVPAGVALCGYRCLEVLGEAVVQAGATRLDVRIAPLSTGLRASCTFAGTPDDRAIAAWLRACGGSMHRSGATTMILDLPFQR